MNKTEPIPPDKVKQKTTGGSQENQHQYFFISDFLEKCHKLQRAPEQPVIQIP